jgi:hypothetical protein
MAGPKAAIAMTPTVRSDVELTDFWHLADHLAAHREEFVLTIFAQQYRVHWLGPGVQRGRCGDYLPPLRHEIAEGMHIVRHGRLHSKAHDG